MQSLHPALAFRLYRLGLVVLLAVLALMPLSPAGPASAQSAGPYPASYVIDSITWDWATHTKAAPGSDLWPVTWADDGNLYTAGVTAALAAPTPMAGSLWELPAWKALLKSTLLSISMEEPLQRVVLFHFLIQTLARVLDYFRWLVLFTCG
jgi:hypothetical protein